MSPRKFARRTKKQSAPDSTAGYNPLCQGCALARAGAPCVPPNFHAYKECHILAASDNGYSHFPFMVIDAADYHVRLANLATGIRVPVNEIKCFELSHKRSQPCGNCDYSCPMAEIKQTGQPVATTHHHYHSSGEEEAYQIHAHPVFDDNGDVIQIVEYAFQLNESDQSETLPDPIAQYVLPLVRTLTSKTGHIDPDYVERLADCLDSNIPRPRDQHLQARISRLSADELAICKMMKHDLSSREMALLSDKNISQINNRRRRIRQKLGLTRSPINLNHYLQTRW
jgi:DNA-binding CsgD family transcriptional regulator